MILSWHYFINIVFIVSFGKVLSQNESMKSNQVDWREVEALAEEHPYVVALLNATEGYLCTGTVLNERTVLTSGTCIVPELYFIAVGVAVLSKSMNRNSLFEIADTSLHVDYAFELRWDDPNVTKTHSNLGLVFSVRSELMSFLPEADYGEFYKNELHNKIFKTVGYGYIKLVDKVILQSQDYLQTPCWNPKWFYCVCGYEHTLGSETYNNAFGKGAPLFLGSKLIGIAAIPSRSVEWRTKLNYNIFTVVGPYLSWMEKTHADIIKRLMFRAGLDAKSSWTHRNTFPHSYILLVINVLNYSRF